ncbi:uncharacterized protein LOC112538816 [Tetranychus urticae]|uniref:uncharacterized protein LOC112538816 n=1 Tax=Tetranychus urticae TaxID=32264 RepID=UPI000D650FDE|nr:uncharacterized protein LOC112538816 [Tetranychus urticae]
MRSLSSFFILCIVLSINGMMYSKLVWSHNRTFLLHYGAASIDTPVRFYISVTNHSESNDTSYEYRFTFDEFPQHDKTIVSTEGDTMYSVQFASTCEPKEGNYTVRVDVWECQLGVQTLSIGAVNSSFELFECNYIEMGDNGPITFDAPITFSVFNHHRVDDPSYEYRFAFDQFPQHDKTIVSTSRSVEYSLTFESSSTWKAGNYKVKVDVWFLRVPSYSLGTVLYTFELSDSLIGFIDKDQNHFYVLPMDNLVVTVMPVKLTAEIRDPTGFFTGRCGIPPANITYKWIVNDEVQEENSKVIERTFSQPQLNNISVIVTATKTNGSRLIQKSGTFNITLESKHPMNNLTFDGPTEVKVFERHQLDLTLTLEEPNTDVAVVRDINESYFSIINYFSEKGTIDLHIVLRNEVSTISERVTIKVH